MLWGVSIAQARIVRQGAKLNGDGNESLPIALFTDDDSRCNITGGVQEGGVQPLRPGAKALRDESKAEDRLRIGARFPTTDIEAAGAGNHMTSS